ncbi:MAG: fibrillarin-like rRNA/tRNA 2'-O-methyltransferase [Candidatus Diapherotrites archaeon]
MQIQEISQGIYKIQNNIATKNLTPGKKVYGEKTITHNNTEYRIWDPTRSKLGAAIKNGLKEIPLKKGTNVLYLGAAEGTTISHISDIIEEQGTIYGIDISARAMRKFVYLCEQRPNIIPILADANQPQTYLEHIQRFSIDLVFQDISQKNQAEIFLKNCRTYLKTQGTGMLTIKARSISQNETTQKIFKEETKKIEKELKITQIINLEPYEKEHELIVCKKK